MTLAETMVRRASPGVLDLVRALGVVTRCTACDQPSAEPRKRADEPRAEIQMVPTPLRG